MKRLQMLPVQSAPHVDKGQRVDHSPGRLVDLVGATSLLAVVAHSTLSYPLALSQPVLSDVNHQAAFIHRILQSLASPAIELTFSRLSEFLGSTGSFLFFYMITLIINTLCFGFVFYRFLVVGHSIPEWLPTRMLAWAIAFGIAASFAFNVTTQDFWLSVVWGRMFDQSINPFVVPYLPGLSQDLPLDHPLIRMTYGPLWAIVSGAITSVSFGSPVVSWILFKATLLACWIGSLLLVGDLGRGTDPRKRCWAILVVGWLPLSFDASLGEGHNDIAMMFFALIWLQQLRAGRLQIASLALLCSILIKYTTAPLLLAHALFVLCRLRIPWWRVLRESAASIAILFLVAAWFVWSGSYNNGAASMVKWRFLGPVDFVRGVAHLIGLDVVRGEPIEALAFLAFVAVVAVSAWEFYRHPSDTNFYKTIVSVLSLTTFVLVGHVWPWFIMWCLVFIALVPDFWLSWFVLGVASIAPFSIVHWWRVSDASDFYRSQLSALAMYGTALALIGVYLARGKYLAGASRREIGRA